MKKTERAINIFTGLVLIISICFASSITVFAATPNTNFVSNEISEEETVKIKEYEKVAKDSLHPILGDQTIKSCEYLYNLDDSADYVYIEFESGGYAIYAKDTMEMLEYSLMGHLPYTDSNLSKYYAGPANYLYKNEKNQFFDTYTGNQINITETEIDRISNQIREKTINNNETKASVNFSNEEITNKTYEINSATNTYSTPKLDEESLIMASTETGYLIPNYKYFTLNPKIGLNLANGSYGNGNSGTCGPIAAQLLLGYNNYYNDRRIIEDRFLLGYDDATNTVTHQQSNPNYCEDPMFMSSWTLGTRSENTGTNSFYSEIISRIMEPNTDSSSIIEVKNGIEDYLSDYLPSSGFSVDYAVSLLINPINSSIIKEELETGRPLIIGMNWFLGGSNHFVVGYGYQDYTYADGSGTYEGYVVHFGWNTNAISPCTWINSNWCDSYISLKINHTHNYNAVGAIPETDRIEYKCQTCNHRTDASINMSSSNRYLEHVVSLPQNDYTYKDIYVKFKTTGNKLFQTFGTKDAVMYLYDTEYNQVAYDDDSGEGYNAFFHYSVVANKAYILRVKFYSSSTTGNIKIGVAPTIAGNESQYENITHAEGLSKTFHFTTALKNVIAITFTPTESGTYKFQTYSTDDPPIDAYLYVVNPRTTTACLSDDDSGEDLQAMITMNLVAGRRYFIILSTFNIVTESGYLCLRISKQN